jgi:hypothetical protein
MPNRDDIFWFKQQFHDEIKKAVKDTPFSLDMITALACQETGYVWRELRKSQLNPGKILELCVGDTIDGNATSPKKGRTVFPKNKAELVARPNGEEMFRIARQALVNMAQYVSSYRSAAANPNKFCRGFGVLQYDLQFFRNDPDFFLEKRYADFAHCLEKCLGELRVAMKKLEWQSKASLSDYEMACVAIVYNKGSFNPKNGLKQGHRNGNKYYGEDFFDYLRLSHAVPTPGENNATLTSPAPGRALVSPPSPVKATGPLYEVDVRSEQLRLRSEPKIDQSDPRANVIIRLPDGHIVRAVTNKPVKGFLEVETSLLGALYRGFASVQYLKPASGVTAVPAPTPAPTPPGSGIVAVYMPRKQDDVTRRAKIANAHSLNEPNQPGRAGATADELRAELAAIIDWLAVDKAAHLRYQRRETQTFCNVYAHDYCHLAGVYLPRVWWTPAAIELLAQEKSVQPLYDNTIEEVRANALFRWLRDFGLRFGWRPTGTLSKLQLEVNQGAIGLIVARREQEGRSGHLAVVVPETGAHRARRDAAGEVIAPLQSQAGINNFRYGTGKPNWWKDSQFAEHAFWLHA